jgi:peptidoglycan L-alanyl-D-glutamate endopeptidase CwlK
MFTKSSIERLNLCDPRLQAAVKTLHGLALVDGLNVQVACGFRSHKEQAELYASGRTAPGPIKTNARPGMSAHNVGQAVDLYFLVDGKADWGIGKFRKLAGLAHAAKLPLEWSGKWLTFKEYCHFELIGE